MGTRKREYVPKHYAADGVRRDVWIYGKDPTARYPWPGLLVEWHRREDQWWARVLFVPYPSVPGECDLPVLFVAVRCPIDIVRARRIATWGGTGFTKSSVTDDPVEMWQRALDATGPYDLTIDTSVTSPDEAADIIKGHLLELPKPSALQRYSADT